MPYADPRARHLYSLRYRREHHQERLEYDRQYRAKNREKLAAYRRQWIAKNKTTWSAYWRGYRQRLKFEVLSHYARGPPKCACCGESLIEFLTLNHVNGDGATHRRSLTIPGAMKNRRGKIGSGQTGGHRFYSWLKQMGYPSDIELNVLCWNCNAAIGFFKICPHVERPETFIPKHAKMQVEVVRVSRVVRA